MNEQQKIKTLRQAWKNLKARCSNTKHPSYPRYGGRGISVCDEWDDFAVFYSDMGFSYKEGLSIERIDNDKGYSFDNCRWATKKEQDNNRRTNHLIQVGREIMNTTQWAVKLGVNVDVIYGRLKLGWSDEKAVTTPLLRHRTVIHTH